jgi:hypothetical protein
MIPKIIFQTSINKLGDNIVNQIKSNSEGWDYKHFDDSEIIRFFENHPLQEFPNIINKFFSIKCGPHKSDLFRYYFLYIYGGVYLDSDAMIYDSINNIVKDFSFFSVLAVSPENIFQGFIGCEARHEIIYLALKDIYEIDIDELDRVYFTLTSNMYKIIHDNNNNLKYDNVKLYKEFLTKNRNQGITYNDSGKIILVHYCGWPKEIPSELDINIDK